MNGYGDDFYSDGYYGFTNLIIITSHFDAPDIGSAKFSDTDKTQVFDAPKLGVVSV